jgi:predicted MFS family arabinose efflux permease
MGLSLLPLIWLDPVEHFSAFRTVLLVHAFAAATQDASIDRLAISTVPDGERGRINGYMQAGMLAARSLFGGVSLVIAESIGWHAVMVAMVACILVTMTLVAWTPRGTDPPAGSLPGRFNDFLGHLRAAARLRATWIGLLFALVSAAGFEATGSLLGPFLVDSGYSQGSIGAFFALPGIVATIAGGLLGGWMTDRFGFRKSLGAGIVAFSVPVIALGTMGLGGTPYPVSPFVILTALYFFIGMFTTSSYALFMKLTRPALGATQFSSYMSATNACESWATWSGGRLTLQAGYGGTFIVMALVSLASLALLPFLRPKEA